MSHRMRLLPATLLLLGLLLVCGTALGSETDPVADDESEAVSPVLSAPIPLEIGTAILKLGIALVLVVGLILGLQRLARRYGRSFQPGGAGEPIRILSQKSLGARLSLALVEVMGHRFLVGISPQGIRRVADLGDADDSNRADPVWETDRSAHSHENQSPGILSRLTGWRRQPPRAATPIANPVPDGAANAIAGTAEVPSFENELRDRLKAISEQFTCDPSPDFEKGPAS